MGGVAGPLLVLLLGGCGLSAQSEPESVAVPGAGATSATTSTPGVPLTMQVYLVHGRRLERVTRAVSPGKGVDPVLRALSAPVGAAELAAGLRTALPASSHPLTGTMSGPRTADVSVPPGYDRLSIAEQEVAMAQIVFTVSADTLAAEVRLVSGSEPVPVPVSHGQLVTRPVSRQDYADLAPPH